MCILADVDSVLIYWLADMPNEGWNSTTYQPVGLIKTVSALNGIHMGSGHGYKTIIVRVWW